MANNWDRHDTAILDAITGLDKPYVVTIADECDLTRRPVTERLRRMRESGLVERRKDLDDARRRIYHLTSDGWRKYRLETMSSPMQGAGPLFDPDRNY